MYNDVKLKFVVYFANILVKMSEIYDSVVDEQSQHDNLRNSDVKRRVAYIASLEYVQKCDCLPKVNGRVDITDILELELDMEIGNKYDDDAILLFWQ